MEVVRATLGVEDGRVSRTELDFSGTDFKRYVVEQSIAYTYYKTS